MWATEHALIDPYRYQFMLRSFKSAYGAERFYGVSRYLRLTPPWMLQSGYGVYRIGSGLSTAPSSSSSATGSSSGGN
jgi:hypothetical protein